MMKKTLVILFLLCSLFTQGQTTGDNGHWESFEITYTQFVASGITDTIYSLGLTQLSRCKQVHAVRQITTQEFQVTTLGDPTGDSVDVTVDFVNADLSGYKRVLGNNLEERSFNFDAPYACCGPHDNYRSSGINIFSSMDGLYINATIRIHSTLYNLQNVTSGVEKIWLYVSEVPDCDE